MAIALLAGPLLLACWFVECWQASDPQGVRLEVWVGREVRAWEAWVVGRLARVKQQLGGMENGAAAGVK